MAGIGIGVLISGGGSNLQALIDHAQRGALGGEIKLVISSNSQAYGLERAKLAGIPRMVISRKTHPDEQQREEALLRALKEAGVTLVVLAGYLGILSPRVIAAYPNRIINIHPSLLPSFSGKGFYGIKVHEAALERGVKVTGATVHFVNEETDGGPIILQRTVPVEPEDDPKTLQQRVLALEHQLLPEAVSLFAKGKLQVVGNRVLIQEGE